MEWKTDMFFLTCRDAATAEHRVAGLEARLADAQAELGEARQRCEGLQVRASILTSNLTDRWDYEYAAALHHTGDPHHTAVTSRLVVYDSWKQTW